MDLFKSVAVNNASDSVHVMLPYGTLGYYPNPFNFL